MGSPSVNKPLTNADASPFAARYRQGEAFETVRRAAGVYANTLQRAFRRLGVSLRPEDDICPICRVCGARVTNCTRRHLCQAHVRWFCSRCEELLPPGRANRWCPPCEAAHKERYYAQPDRLCTQCGKAPVTARRTCCPACDQDKYRLERRALLRVERHCRECPAPLPRGRRAPRCMTCQRKHLYRLRRQREARGNHRCGICRKALWLNQQSYCDICSGMLDKWRRATHAGQGWGKVQKRRQWQEREAA